eukprot:Mrub_01794.p1 GENE.Mrub_01794~~Mrub_01794.p1  ORF type:complete len:656 (+),score=146.01 Mrub_01794:186-1970(+)
MNNNIEFKIDINDDNINEDEKPNNHEININSSKNSKLNSKSQVLSNNNIIRHQMRNKTYFGITRHNDNSDPNYVINKFNMKDLVFACKEIKIENMRSYFSKDGIENCRLIKLNMQNFNDMVSIMILVALYTYNCQSEDFVRMYSTYQINKSTFSNFTFDNLKYFGLSHYIILNDEVNMARINESLNNKYINIDDKNYERKLLDEKAAFKLENSDKFNDSTDSSLPATFKNLKKKNHKLETIKKNKDIDKEIYDNLYRNTLRDKYSENLSKIEYVKNYKTKRDNYTAASDDQVVEITKKNWQMTDFEKEVREELKISKQKAELQKKTEIVSIVKNQRDYKDKSMENNKRNKSFLAQSVKEYKKINNRKMEDTTVDFIHNLIDMKEKAEINKELNRQRNKSMHNSFNISKKLGRIGATVRNEVISLTTETKLEEKKQKVIDQRMSSMDAKKRSQLSMIDGFNKRQKDNYEYKAQIRTKKSELKEEKEKLKEYVGNIRQSKHLNTDDTRSTNFPYLEYNASNFNSVNLTNSRPRIKYSSGRVNIRFTEEILPLNKQHLQFTTEMSYDRKDMGSSDMLGQDRPDSRLKTHYSTRYGYY